MKNKISTLAAAIIVAFSILTANAATDITASVPTWRSMTIREGSIGWFLAGTRIQQDGYNKVWNDSTAANPPTGYYAVVYTASKTTEYFDEHQHWTTDYVEVDLQFKKSATGSILKVAHKRVWKDGIKLHPGNSGWTYYGNDAQQVANDLGYSNVDAGIGFDSFVNRPKAFGTESGWRYHRDLNAINLTGIQPYNVGYFALTLDPQGGLIEFDTLNPNDITVITIGATGYWVTDYSTSVNRE